jgi:protein ImuB
MLDHLIYRAGSRSLALASVTVTLDLDGAAAQDAAAAATESSEHIRTIKPALPLMDRDLFLKLIHLDLQAHPPAAAVIAIHLSAEPGDRSKVQLGLFSPQLPEPTRLDITLARIAALVGEEHVGRARLLDTHRPDSFVVERFTSPSNLKTQTACTAEGILALRKLRPSLPLSMRLQEDRPIAFPMEGKQYDVVEAHGPWRRSGDWWATTIWSRDEWDVRASTRDGEVLLCVLVHDLLRNQWQLEALYD